ncbi:FtsB family cell division protein [Halobacillus naozhouensis]|uniref:Septum formation initiator family protein n=1 Tax=Halobacillus naozhouensis TaxID=554880 RepID=A0ABY8IXM0_9BACI|nr:septum formation initiator family protein [Halobacillus naozhouensis]WFT74955.1 septum formation initiator family protein [Halobacillus naozhouensis]
MAKKQSVARLDSTYMKHYDAYMERQTKKKKRLFRRIVLFALFVMIVAGSMVTYHVQQQSLHAQKQEHYEDLQAKMDKLKKEEKNLKEEIKLLNNEEYVLQIARSDYFFSKEGEIIFKMPNEDPSY